MNRYLIYVDTQETEFKKSGDEDLDSQLEGVGKVWKTFEVDAESETQAEQLLIESGQLLKGEIIRPNIMKIETEQDLAESLAWAEQEA